MRKAYQYRIYPTKKQETKLNETLEECRWLYNHLLARRKDAYEQDGLSLSLYQQQATFPILKAERPSLATVHSQVLQNEAGRTFIKVNPAYTSQTCSRCKHRQPMPLSERVFDCPCCHLLIDRDHNAALNILALGLQGIGTQSVEAPSFSCGE